MKWIKHNSIRIDLDQLEAYSCFDGQIIYTFRSGNIIELNYENDEHDKMVKLLDEYFIKP